MNRLVSIQATVLMLVAWLALGVASIATSGHWWIYGGAALASGALLLLASSLPRLPPSMRLRLQLSGLPVAFLGWIMWSIEGALTHQWDEAWYGGITAIAALVQFAIALRQDR